MLAYRTVIGPHTFCKSKFTPEIWCYWVRGTSWYHHKEVTLKLLKSLHSGQLNGGLTFLTPSEQSPSLSTLKVHLQKQLFREHLTHW